MDQPSAQDLEQLYSTEEFNRQLEQVQQIARQIKRDQKGEMLEAVLNVVHLVPGGYDVLTLSPNFSLEGNEGRQQAMRVLGQEVGELKLEVVAVYLTSEAWVGTPVRPEESYTPPSEDPASVEVLMTSGRTLDGRANYIWDKIDGAKLSPLVHVPWKPERDKPAIQSSLFEAFYYSYSLHFSLGLLEALGHLSQDSDSQKTVEEVRELIKRKLADSAQAEEGDGKQEN